MTADNNLRGSKRRIQIALVGAILLMPGFFIAGPASASITGVQPPQSGNWLITSATEAINETITLAGNIVISSTLTLKNTTIKFDCSYDGQYGIEVLDGGCIDVRDIEGDASNITSNNQYAYTFRIRDGGCAMLINSEFHKCGYYPGQIDYRSGLSIESSDVTIQGCTFSNNYIGLLFNSVTDLNIDSNYDDSSSIMTKIAYNEYGIYAVDSTDIDFDNAIFNNNSIYDLYLDGGSTAYTLDCYPISPTHGGAGSLFTDFSEGLVFYEQDYFEIEYNEDSQTFRYDGWSSGGGGVYAAIYCVVRRGHDFTIKENLAALKGWEYLYNPIWGWARPCGFMYTISTDTEEDRELVELEGSTHVLSIPEDYPIGYFTLNCQVYWRTGYGQYSSSLVATITIFVIFDLPSTTGTDDATDLTSNGLAEYLYIGDDGVESGLPSDIDLCGPYYKKQSGGMTYYYYGRQDSQFHKGLNYNDITVVQVACHAANGEYNEWDAATDIQALVNILVAGDWQTGGATMAWTYNVEYHLEYVTNDMASDPTNEIVSTHTHPASASDSLGIHCSDPENGYVYTQNVLQYQCHDYAAISTALCRALGIAARQVTGYTYVDGTYNWSYHVWTEAWIPDDNDGGTSYDDQWDVFDACGVDLDGQNQPIDDNPDCYDAATRNDYYDNLNTADFGTPSGDSPTGIYAMMITNQGPTQITLTSEYTG